jgi:hypothetical protein
MHFTNSRNNPSLNKITETKHKHKLCPNRLDTDYNTNARLTAIKIINKKKLSVDTDNWQLVTSPTKRIISPGTSPNPKLSNNQKIFSTPNDYSSLSVENNINNTNNTDTEMENDDISIRAPPPIFIKSNINNYLRFCEAIKNLNTSTMGFSYKTTSNSLKLVTSTSNSYRTVIRYLNPLENPLE